MLKIILVIAGVIAVMALMVDYSDSCDRREYERKGNGLSPCEYNQLMMGNSGFTDHKWQNDLCEYWTYAKDGRIVAIDPKGRERVVSEFERRRI